MKKILSVIIIASLCLCGNINNVNAGDHGDPVEIPLWWYIPVVIIGLPAVILNFPGDLFEWIHDHNPDFFYEKEEVCIRFYFSLDSKAKKNLIEVVEKEGWIRLRRGYYPYPSEDKKIILFFQKYSGNFTLEVQTGGDIFLINKDIPQEDAGRYLKEFLHKNCP